MTTLETMPLTRQVLGLLQAVYGAARGVVQLHVGRGSAKRFGVIRLDGRRVEYIPEVLLKELEYPTPDDLALEIATRREPAGPLLDLPSAFVEIPTPRTFDVKQRAWLVSPDVVAEVGRRLAAFPVRPGAIVDHDEGLAVLWPLACPLRLDVPAERDRAERLQQALARALGGRVDEVAVSLGKTTISNEPVPYATLPGWAPARPVLRVPGSRSHHRAAAGVPVDIVALDPTATTTAEQLEAATKEDHQ